MKKIKVFLSAIAISLAFASCDKSVFKQFDDDFTENRWQKNDVHRYEFDIPTAGNYDLMVNFSSVYGGQFAAIPIKITIENPDKTIVEENITLRLADDQGHNLADCSGDYCDLEEVVFSGKKMEAGHYKIALSNEFDHEFLPNVLGLGIRVVAVKR